MDKTFFVCVQSRSHLASEGLLFNIVVDHLLTTIYIAALEFTLLDHFLPLGLQPYSTENMHLQSKCQHTNSTSTTSGSHSEWCLRRKQTCVNVDGQMLFVAISQIFLSKFFFSKYFANMVCVQYINSGHSKLLDV